MEQNSLQITVLKLVFNSATVWTARGAVSECGQKFACKADPGPRCMMCCSCFFGANENSDG